ncbi:hypothetical protein EXIGLDRAFT_701163 [Exidia glandulosa HHB12029]|uniref:Uncharacterized protein n=1 Tax=Exidia glandulosa HHB12029 TaxID=1314781 RepID=A0A165ZL27_EXIGL|nr:hypothetical protein EXIGLDRAFT_701163 [Exidia glandulosa HHB12029]
MSPGPDQRHKVGFTPGGIFPSKCLSPSRTVCDVFRSKFTFSWQAPFDLRFPELFRVQVGENQGKAIVYPIKVCEIKPGQLYGRTLSLGVTHEMQTMGACGREKNLRDIEDRFHLCLLNFAEKHHMRG